MRVSIPGRYRGYSEPVADGFVRTSEYVLMDDGCRIAVDILRPTLRGAPLEEPLPTIAQFTGYRRAWIMGESEPASIRRIWPHRRPGEHVSMAVVAAELVDGRRSRWPAEADGLPLAALADWVAVNGGAPEHLLLHGYNVVVADTRASGASFGLPTEQGGTRIGRDIAAVFETVAAKPFSNGEFGMVGASWMGATQYMASTFGAPRLKAIMPQVAPVDQYLSLWPGGIFDLGLMRDWLEQMTGQDRVSPALPVDDDTEGRLRDEAVAARGQAGGGEVQALIDAMGPLTRDQFQAGQGLARQPLADGSVVDLAQSPLDFESASRGGIATYVVGGWWDIYAAEAPLAFANLELPKKLVMGPWHHANTAVQVEALRWFDHWLKGVSNGIMDEPPVVLAVADEGERNLWRGAAQWPPVTTAWTLGLGPGGELTAAPACGEFRVRTDAEAGTGSSGRSSGYNHGPRLDYARLAGFGTRSTSRPLASPVEIVGSPILELELIASGDPARVFAWLLALDGNRRAHMLSDGRLDLSHRAEVPPPHDAVGLPWRSYEAASAAEVDPGARLRVRFAMNPVGWRCAAGDRLVLVLACADGDNTWTRNGDAPAELLIRTGDAGSRLILPVLSEGAAPEIPDAYATTSDYSRAAIRPFAFD